MDMTFDEQFPSLKDEHCEIQVMLDEKAGHMVQIKMYEQQVLMDHVFDKQILQIHLEQWMNMAKQNDPALIRAMFEVYQECEWEEDLSEGP